MSWDVVTATIALLGTEKKKEKEKEKDKDKGGRKEGEIPPLKGITSFHRVLTLVFVLLIH